MRWQVGPPLPQPWLLAVLSGCVRGCDRSDPALSALDGLEWTLATAGTGGSGAIRLLFRPRPSVPAWPTFFTPIVTMMQPQHTILASA